MRAIKIYEYVEKNNVCQSTFYTFGPWDSSFWSILYYWVFVIIQTVITGLLTEVVDEGPVSNWQWETRMYGLWPCDTWEAAGDAHSLFQRQLQGEDWRQTGKGPLIKCNFSQPNGRPRPSLDRAYLWCWNESISQTTPPIVTTPPPCLLRAPPPSVSPHSISVTASRQWGFPLNGNFKKKLTCNSVFPMSHPKTRRITNNSKNREKTHEITRTCWVCTRLTFVSFATLYSVHLQNQSWYDLRFWCGLKSNERTNTQEKHHRRWAHLHFLSDSRL